MSTSYYSLISRFAKKLTGIKDFSLWRKQMRKTWGKCIYHKKYTSTDLVNVMSEMGMQRGSIVCIHSSMKEFYNFVGSPEEIIKDILEFIGPDGTLLMPAFPVVPNHNYSDYIFDPIKAPTGAGLLAETFRKYPGVKRSNNVQHSVCAIGKYADELLNEHTLGYDCWDQTSPWYKMCQLDALVFNLGMPRWYIGTFHHCVESLLKHTHPYWAQFFNKSQEFKYLDRDGVIQTYTNRISALTRRTRERKVTKFFTSSDWKIFKLSNLEIKVFRSKGCLNKMVKLGQRGICVYYEPSPLKYKFDDVQ